MTKKYLLLLMFALALILPGCTKTLQTDSSYTQIRPMEFDGELVMPGGELLEDKYFQSFFKKAGYVLIGESHTNMTDHMSQAAIIKKMAQRRLKPVIGLEMADVDSQPALNRFNSGEITVDQLEEALNWPRSVGYSFELYRPIFEVAAEYKIPVYALNLPRHVVRQARLDGLDKIEAKNKKYLPEKFIPVTQPQRERLTKFFQMHPGLAGAKDGSGTMQIMPGASGGPAQLSPAERQEREKMLEGFMTAQALWDSAMAERAAQIHGATRRPVVIIAGQGHVEYGWGIAHRLAAHDDSAVIIKVMPWRAPLESVFMRQQRSPLLDGELPSVFPTPDMADIYYYSPLVTIGKAPQGLITGQNPGSMRQQIMILGVVPGSAAEKAGFLAGDIIMSIERRSVSSGEGFYSVLAQCAAYEKNPVIVVRRGAEKVSLELDLR